VECAVILSETDTFDVDESWLNAESDESSTKKGLSAFENREVEMIEAALAESHGRYPDVPAQRRNSGYRARH
jgi:hypothetical protein